MLDQLKIRRDPEKVHCHALRTAYRACKGPARVGTVLVTKDIMNRLVGRRVRQPAQRRAIGAIALVLAAGALGGCGLSSLTSGIGGGMFGSAGAAKSNPEGVSTESLLTAAKADQPETAAASADIAGGCPKFTVASRDSQVTIYEAGRVGDGLAVVHRGEITKTARECRLENNRVFVKYGFSGKILLGPRGKNGNVQLPLTVYVTDAKRERVTQDAVRIDVPVALDKPIGYFSAVREVSFPVPEGARAGEFEVHVGFDRNIPGAG